MYYYRARYYHPQLQRFISEDPFPGFRTLPQSLNGYPYALNNPQLLSDSDGKFPGPTGVVGGAIVGGITGGVGGYLSGGVTGALAGGVAGAVTGALSGAVTGALGGGVIGGIAGETVGGIVGEMLDPSGTVHRDETYFPPVIKNPPVPSERPRPPDPFRDQKIQNPPTPPDPFKDHEIKCPPGGCRDSDMGGRKDKWH
jgi:hypothetical protein